ncbi:hypothetical protein VTK56DRAFT_296 [Thermocarpiscus australiensis]
MSGEKDPAAAPTEGAPPAVETKDNATTSAPAEAQKEAVAAETKPAAESGGVAEVAPANATEGSDKATEAPTDKPTEQPEEKPDVEMTDAAAAAAPAEPAPQATDSAETAAPAEQAEQAADATAADADADADKSKSKQRKSIGGGESKGKKLNKKASKARILHLDAQPGEHYFVKLKGHPQWPVIICDEDMLPASLLKTRPVTAKRADGTYREDFADGGKKVAERTFPVMYLHTNEFGWVPNSELIELDPATVMEKADKMKGALRAAHELAAENHPLSYYKDVLQKFQEELIQREKAKAAKAATPKSKKAKAVSEEDEDVEMEDAAEVEETPAKDKKAKKRKAEDSAETPQRSDSVKKPKIKLTTSSTPKAANGSTSTPKSTKAAESKSASKSKPKKAKEAEEKKAEKVVAAPKEPELSPEDRHARKEKEVLFLRHKLQKGLLTRDQEPKEEEMKLMSDYITKLEGFPDLEVSIIRATKINKVLKAILKLENIPKEEEFKFKPRSQALLDKWNKLLAVDGTAAEGASTVNGTAAASSKAGAKQNGVKEAGEAAEPVKAKEEAKTESKEGAKEEVQQKEEKKEESKGESKEEPKEAAKPQEASAPAEKQPAAEETKAAEAVETSA